jgi:hypothetical protein
VARGTLAGRVFIESTDKQLNAKDIRGILQAAIDNGTILEPDPSSVYMLFLDDRTRVNDKVASVVMCAPESDTAFRYHHFFLTKAGNPRYFAVIPCLPTTA